MTPDGFLTYSINTVSQIKAYIWIYQNVKHNITRKKLIYWGNKWQELMQNVEQPECVVPLKIDDISTIEQIVKMNIQIFNNVSIVRTSEFKYATTINVLVENFNINQNVSLIYSFQGRRVYKKALTYNSLFNMIGQVLGKNAFLLQEITSRICQKKFYFHQLTHI